ncbi:uncharacterized protein [Bemisia tabaci]|uniref:uncharacterized protein isoform X2 n=1 Tax=Bemisia tabaci TaxID=7038 RepID=UPI0008F9B980|nr:PREDICTED: uncharacterized protein LOC109043168 isoform X2 [Bemisia tabaci]
MGNSGSSQLHSEVGHQAWASFPRAGPLGASQSQGLGGPGPSLGPHFKVLPERVPGQRLRVTDNGAILRNCGTISGRRHYQLQLPVRCRSSSQGRYEPDPNARVVYGSEPDLRFPNREYPSYTNESPAKLRISRSRKKYKAPPAPQTNGLDSSSPDSYQHWENSGNSSEVTAPVRRLRLFKTRAETSKKVRGGPEGESTHSQDASLRQSSAHNHRPPHIGQLQRSLSSPQFQVQHKAELMKATERIRMQKGVREPPVGRAAESPSSSPILRSRENIVTQRPLSRNSVDSNKKPVSKQSEKEMRPRTKIEDKKALENKQPPSKERLVKKESTKTRPTEPRVRGEGSTGRESTPEIIPRNKHNADGKSWDIIPTTKPMAPVKTFYFGMDGTGVPPTDYLRESEAVEKFAASLQTSLPANLSNETSNSESISSEHAGDESGGENNGISLQLRPTLPRKQLDIPRFSPTAAWRLLSALESPVQSEEDDLVMLEERIPLPAPLHHHEKSGDSGISGDASPHSTHNSQAAWTPQQDLEETSSDGGLESAPVSPESLGTAKFSPRFSLSLPRDDRLSLYVKPDKMGYSDSHQPSSLHSLKKLRRSVSGAFGRSVNSNNLSHDSNLNENWVLSRSVPSSLNHRWSDSSPENEDDLLLSSLTKQPSFSYLATGGHVMYLPGQLPEINPISVSTIKNSEPSSLQHNEPQSMSKSCDALNSKESAPCNPPRFRTGRKFTFQSTVRQIERRRIAEKLSKEAEQKERQRLSELEAMRRVEEEFQRKREREKADIRHQLRLYSLTQGGREAKEATGVNLPPPPSTQILSEFREPRRDYRDYRPSRSDAESAHSDSGVKKATVHPQVVYQMPKTTQVYVTPRLHANHSGDVEMPSPKSSSSDNYRRNFAQGALPHSLASSDSEISQPNTRPTSRNLVYRSRSVSPQADEMNNCISPILNNGIIPEEDEKKVQPSNEGRPQPLPRLGVTSLQPFVRGKSYRPIVFNPSNSNVAQIAS